MSDDIPEDVMEFLTDAVEDAILNALEESDWYFLSLQNGVIRFDGTFKRAVMAQAIIARLHSAIASSIRSSS